MRFIWRFQDNSFSPGSAEKPDTQPQAPEGLFKEIEGHHIETKEHEADLKDFFTGINKISPDEKEKLKNLLDQCEQNSDVEAIRRAGVTESENKEDYLKRHRLLASAFLESAPGGGKKFMVNFQGNTLAEWKVGAAEMLPPNVSSIFVDKDGTRIKAIRTRNPATGRIGYYEESALKGGIYDYVAVHTGDTIEIASTDKIKPNDKRILAEHKAIYEEGAMEESASEADELRYDAETGKLYSLAATAQLERGRRGVVGNTRELLQNFDFTGISVPEIPGQAGQLVKTAVKYANSDRFKSDFERMPSLKGGKLGCAWVASSILMEAGYLNSRVAGVDATVTALKSKGWTVATTPPQPGDVVVWKRMLRQDKNSGDWEMGHKHIGIVVAPGVTLDNKSGPPAGPRLRSLNRGRGIEVALRPPGVAPMKELTQAPPERTGQRNTTLAMWNKNPGNLRYSKLQAGKSEGFAYFNTFKEGWEGLLRDVRIKQTGRSKSKLKPTSTLEEFFKVYCPANDNPINKPLEYARNVARRLGVPVNTSISQVPTEELAREITRQEDHNVFKTLFGKRGERKTPVFPSEAAAPSASAVAKAAPSARPSSPSNIPPHQLAPQGTVPIGKLSRASAEWNRLVRSQLPKGVTTAPRAPVAAKANYYLSVLQPGQMTIDTGTDGNQYVFFKEVHAAKSTLPREHYGISVMGIPDDYIFRQGLDSEKRMA